MKDWETKHKNQEILRKKELRNQANNSKYFYQRCLTLERKIFEMEVNFIFYISSRSTILIDGITDILMLQRFLADYGLVWVGDAKSATSTANVSK